MYRVSTTEFLIPNTFRWLPQINTSRFRYDASTFARITNSCENTKNAATRWMTFVKNRSPGPIPGTDRERKPSVAEELAIDGSQVRDVKRESPKWEPLRKFAPVATKTATEDTQVQDEAERNRDSPDGNEQSKRLTQRMRDLYDFKTENEWPKRAINAQRVNTWISKSSSEEEKTNQAGRRNSQDLEFNDRVNVIKLKDTKVRSDHQETRRTSTKEQPGGTEIFDSEYEERLRKFNERLRYSEDLGIAKPRIKERRTYSDDYDEKTRRGSTRSARADRSVKSARTEDSTRPRTDGKEITPRSSMKLTRAEGSIRSTRSEDSPDDRVQGEKKRLSDASSKSRGSYADVNPATPVKRDSRTSDASYTSIPNHSGKRASVDCKSTRKMIELPPRRAFSQTEDRPATPVPPVEWNDDRFAVARLKQISEREERDSTRYKVYLT